VASDVSAEGVTVDSSTKRDVLRRLNYVDGHLQGVRRMIEDDKYCVDILKQSYAVERAVQKFEAALLESHLQTCVPAGFKAGRDQEQVRELFELFELSRR